MKKEDLYFPLLAINQELIQTIESAMCDQEQVDVIIKKIQDGCNHVFEDNFINDKSYCCNSKNPHDHQVLNAKLCTLCGLVKERPKGFPWKVCHKCWSPVEYKSILSSKKMRTYFFECTNVECKHSIVRIEK